MGILDQLDAFFNNGQARRKWLNGAVAPFVPPELSGPLRAADMMNFVSDIGRAGQSARRMTDPSLSGWDRAAAGGDMLVDMASVLAPVAAGVKVGAKPVVSLMDALFNWTPDVEDAAAKFGAGESGGMKLWHGSPNEFDKFDDTNGLLWFSDNKGYSEGMAGRTNLSKGDAGSLYSADVDIKNPLTVDVQAEARRALDDAGIDVSEMSPSDIEEAFTGGQGYEFLVDSYSKKMADGGHDSLVFKGTLDGFGRETDQYVLFDGSKANILSRNGQPIPSPPPTKAQQIADMLDGGGFNVTTKDASETFGAGTNRVIYKDPKSGGFIEVLQRPNGNASVLGLEVPEKFRGQGIGQALQSAAMNGNPKLMGQVSSKAAAKTAYRLGRRPYGKPDATLEDVFKMIDEDSSVNMLSRQAQPQPPTKAQASRLSAGAPTPRGVPKVKAPIGDDEIELILNKAGLTRSDLARDYPAVGRPIDAIDQKTGKAYLGKGPSREGDAVAKIRDRLNKEIKTGVGDYVPYYDEAARYDANPANYDRPNLTHTIKPKKQATIDKYEALYNGPEARQKLDDAIASAIEKPDAHGFYKLGQLEDDFIANLGPVDGPKAFEANVMDAMAATTGGADPTSNWLMATFGNFKKQQIMNRIPGANTPPPTWPRAAYEMPYPIGGRYASGNLGMYDKVQGVTGAPTGIDWMTNPKRYDFSRAFGGHLDGPVVDEQMMTLIDEFGPAVPAKGAYGIASGAVSDAAGRANLAPIGGQEVGWAGAKASTGEPMISHINKSIYRTSRLTGLPQEEVVRLMQLGKIPMYGIGGAAVAGGLLADPQAAQASQASQANEIETYLMGIRQ